MIVMFVFDLGVVRAKEFAKVFPGLTLVHFCPVLFGSSYSFFVAEVGFSFFEECCFSGGGVKGFSNGVEVE